MLHWRPALNALIPVPYPHPHPHLYLDLVLPPVNRDRFMAMSVSAVCSRGLQTLINKRHKLDTASGASADES